MSWLVAFDSQVITVTVVFPPDSLPEEPPQADVASSPPAANSAPAVCSVRFNVASWYVFWVGRPRCGQRWLTVPSALRPWMK